MSVEQDLANAEIALTTKVSAPMVASAVRGLHRVKAEVIALRTALEEYASHQSWRCDYRTRYGTCRCGLDKQMEALGLSTVPPNDPEAPK